MAIAEKQPNFLIIVADDLGFSDTSPYGGEIMTPNLQKLSQDGIRMTNFHTAPACSPTRSMLMSGTDHHIAGLGQLAEHMTQAPEKFQNRPGYEGYLNFKVAALPEILRDAGYLNLMSGKWHLGMKKEHSPYARGFHKVFSFLAGSGNHFNYEPQFDDPKYKFPWKGKLWMEDNEYVDRKKGIPHDFYSTTYTTKRMMDFLCSRTEEERQQPFFAYLAYLAPHWPLQAPKDRVEKYKGNYDDGPTKLSEKRLQRLVELGLVPKDVVPAKPEAYVGKAWDDMSPDERAASNRNMEVYAAMVEMIDEGVGEVIDYLASTGELENTFVMFISDNGAEGLMMEALQTMGDGTTMADVINVYFNNEISNIGNKDSFTWYGPEWASAATAPSRGWKTWPTEGGIRCPCIVRYPGFQAAPNAITHKFTTVMDLLPTMLDMAGIQPVGTAFHGREVVPVKGKSWVSHLSSNDFQGTSVHDEDSHVHGWELIGLCAIRKGKWKAVWMHPPRGNGTWELYQVEDDPAEAKDLSREYPDKMEELKACWHEYFAETGMFEYDFVFYVAEA